VWDIELEPFLGAVSRKPPFQQASSPLEAPFFYEEGSPALVREQGTHPFSERLFEPK